MITITNDSNNGLHCEKITFNIRKIFIGTGNTDEQYPEIEIGHSCEFEDEHADLVVIYFQTKEQDKSEEDVLGITFENDTNCQDYLVKEFKSKKVNSSEHKVFRKYYITLKKIDDCDPQVNQHIFIGVKHP